MNDITLDKYTQFKFFDIQQPRYHDDRVLLKASKVGAHNKIKFSKAPTLPDTYYLSGKTIKKYHKSSNGMITCYAVPLDDMKKLKLTENSELEL